MDKTAEMSARPAAREAIVGAFRDIILEAGYEDVRVLDVVKRSGVARSTFYEHFASREDLLRDSLRGIFELLAQLAAPSCDLSRMERVLDHLADNRAMVKSLVANPGTEVLVDVLSEAIEERLSRASCMARAIAGAQLAVLSPWLDGRDARSAAELSRVMRDLSLALVRSAQR
jgi:AcrR family transcriptional regulator